MKFLLVIKVSCLLLLTGCIGTVTTMEPPASAPATAAPSQTLPVAATPPAPTTTATPAATLDRAPTASARLTADALEPTYLYQTNTAFERTQVVEIQATSTALVRDIQATVTPRAFQTMRSPDGQWLAEVIIYDCVQMLPASEMQNSYELLIISSQTVDTQLLWCGGLGAFGFEGLNWSADSRFFYYTDAREGWPDGGYPWREPIYRYDTSSGQSDSLGLAAYSPDGRQIAGAQETDLVIWEVESEAEMRFAGPASSVSWINWLTWAPDGQSLVYLITHCEGIYPCPSLLYHVDLETQTQTELLGKSDPPMLQVDWPEADSLLLYGGDFTSRWIYHLATGELEPVPTATPTSN